MNALLTAWGIAGYWIVLLPAACLVEIGLWLGAISLWPAPWGAPG